MKEPSVLDYLKSRLNPFQKEKIEIPSSSPDQTQGSATVGLQTSTQEGIPGTLPELQVPSESIPKEAVKEGGFTFRLPTHLPWRTIIAFALGFYAQWTLEPPVKTYIIPIVLYIIAVLILVWAYLTGEYNLQPLPEDPIPQIEEWRYHIRLVIFSLPLALLAFVTFGPIPGIGLFPENMFTPLNLTLWLGSVVLFVYGLWIPDRSKPNLIVRIWGFLKHDVWQPRLTRWTILLIAVFALAAFFRFYNVSGVIGEPFSDHAEKLLDVYDVSTGQTHVFFPRNTGREFIQFYWTIIINFIFHTGISFLSLKIGTTLIGFFSLPYIYLLGKEIGGKRVAIFSLLIAGVAYWPNTISRIGLRFPLYMSFAAPVLYYLVRGLRTHKRNDFILSGLFLGLGLHGYTPYRFMPVVVVAIFIVYLLHRQSRGLRKQTLIFLSIVVIASVLVFVPLGRYALDNPQMFDYRTLTRLTGVEQPLPGPAWQIFLSNLGQGMLMFNWDDGQIWVHSIPHRPALDFISAALFLFGFFLLIVRYIQKRHWLDFFLIVSVPLLIMPSVLSLAFPDENPSLNRTDGAVIIVFIIVGMALDGLYRALQGLQSKQGGGRLAGVVVSILLLVLVTQNYNLVFNVFSDQFMNGAWNTSDMGQVVDGFVAMGNPVDNAWVVPYPYWVDTRLVGIQAGYPTRDTAIDRSNLPSTVSTPGNKLFMVKPEDQDTLNLLKQLYPTGVISLFQSPLPGKNFWIYYVPGTQPITAP